MYRQLGWGYFVSTLHVIPGIGRLKLMNETITLQTLRSIIFFIRFKKMPCDLENYLVTFQKAMFVITALRPLQFALV